eukprot:1227797-Ditylum_brightwellii.AAC.1
MSPSWIKSHQDDSAPCDDLSKAAQLNCDANHAAGSFLRQHPPHLQPISAPLLFPANNTTLLVNNVPATCDWENLLWAQFVPSCLFLHIQKKTGMTYTQMQCFDWDNLGIALYAKSLKWQ